ncbi:uncharacterized protein EAF01_002355 [Botrytis porri]|uniref:uncharacterized protein n=1 Tax=Botrytis porri TaxID=87229 RepID=UPI001901C8BB|nr:uncharacterized protein EAF01_002355 [Botrytis porri]KAF7910846.1 hypothetical protein EAF01_002355 [Botrytis porri]
MNGTDPSRLLIRNKLLSYCGREMQSVRAIFNHIEVCAHDGIEQTGMLYLNGSDLDACNEQEKNPQGPDSRGNCPAFQLSKAVVAATSARLPSQRPLCGLGALFLSSKHF